MNPNTPAYYTPYNYAPEKPGSLAARFAAMLTEILETENAERKNRNNENENKNRVRFEIPR